MNKVSIIIPNFNGEKLIEDCVNCLKTQRDVNFDIIVVDDGSEDNSVEIIKKLPVTLIENKVNQGFAYTVNRGIKASRSKFVLLLNNDVFIKDPYFLKSMVTQIERSPAIFSVSSKMIRYYEPEYLDDTGDEYTLFGWVYKRGDGLPVESFNKDSIVFSACAGAGLYRRSAFEEIGYFDPLHFAYLEDVDLGWRAQIYGYINLYSASSPCYHIGSATFASGQKYSRKKVELSARNNIYIIYKNMPLMQLIINLPFLITGFGIKFLYFSKRGFGRDYLSGLREGLITCKKLTKVPFKMEHLDYYQQIQLEMTRATVEYIGLKTKQLYLKVKKKLIGKIDSCLNLL